eukprot:GHRR01004905.1.p1 GENE.GHRR01004905.1~~GHRR01004905.1.p1  ORF type:complete len:378 (+),score=171.71 GHRR01004905.1:406-1539(+)
MVSAPTAEKRARDDAQLAEDTQHFKRAKSTDSSLQQRVLSVPAVSEHVAVSTLLPALKQLLSVYENEYWVLLEDLQSRSDACLAIGCEAAAGDMHPSSQPAGAIAGSASQGSMRGLAASHLKQQHQEPTHEQHQQHEQQQVQQQECPGPLQDGPNVSNAATGQPAAVATAATAATAPSDQQSSGCMYGDKRCGYGSDAAPSLPAPEKLLERLPQGPDGGAATPEQLQAWRDRFKAAAQQVAGLEQLASAATLQYMDAQGGLACLAGASGRWVLRRTAVSLGRSSDSKGDVDVDLSRAGTAARVSRLQAHMSLGLDGSWTIQNMGRAVLQVNGTQVPRGSQVELPHLSLIEVGCTALLFMMNDMAVQRAIARSKHLTM